MISSKSLFFRGCMLAAAITLTAPVLAAAVTGPDVTVRFADIDVDTMAGAVKLLGRIEGAASSVCARLDHGDIASRANREHCEQKLTAAAVAKVNRPLLVEVYESAHHTAPRMASLVR